MLNTATSDGDELAQAGSLGSLSFAIVGFVMITVLPAILPYISRLLRKSHHNNSTSDLRDLIWLWTGTQPVLCLLLALTLAAVYQWQGIVLIAAAGIPWAVTQWVPFAIVGYETSRLGLTPSGGDGEGGEGEDEVDSQSGAILGVHNLAISLPQVLSGLVSSGTYKIAEVAGSEVPTAWVLASSGIAAFVASWLASRMVGPQRMLMRLDELPPCTVM